MAALSNLHLPDSTRTVYPPDYSCFPVLDKDAPDIEHDSDNEIISTVSLDDREGDHVRVQAYVSGGVAEADGDKIINHKIYGFTDTVRPDLPSMMGLKNQTPSRFGATKIPTAPTRDTNSGCRDLAGTRLPEKSVKRRLLPIVQRHTAATDIVRTQALLSRINFTEGTGHTFDLTHHESVPRKSLSLITQKADKLFALQLSDRGDKEVATICHLDNGSITLEISLYEETYCIDVVEGTSRKLIRRWSFFFAANDSAQARAARNLWNHLCSSFTFMPPTLLKPTNFKPLPQSLPYNFRPTTLKRRAIIDGTNVEPRWTIELPRQKITWQFSSFFSLHKRLIDEIEFGPEITNVVSNDTERTGVPSVEQSDGGAASSASCRGRGDYRRRGKARGRGRGRRSDKV